ncbi:integrase catalytic domain-containing protein [Trichonephila inaurata madagascariensis]|uniref:Integrase catalytic domain-containing protein n=1 Tax=Trichonephila inaurata madagascariensis TaxID=2747483 RepID=A0A8X7CQK9_9ARAC|nr:integrase catalytic domain-containing protein [Trichonephila inaurata madagascariensis]
MIDDLGTTIQKIHGVSCLFFADDVVICVTGSNIRSLEEALNSSLLILATGANTNKMEISNQQVFSTRLFSNSLWLEVFSWLLELPSNWSIDRLACQTSEAKREKRKVRLYNLVAVEGEVPSYAIKFSNVHSIIRFVSLMLRFVENMKKKREFREG